MPLWIAILGGFVLLSLLRFVAWEAHLGGLVFGALAGYLFKSRRRYF
jgi:membrane associated rhomboid family serine protease